MDDHLPEPITKRTSEIIRILQENMAQKGDRLIAKITLHRDNIELLVKDGSAVTPSIPSWPGHQIPVISPLSFEHTEAGREWSRKFR